MKSLRETRSGISPLKGPDGNLVEDNRKKADILNEQYCSVFTQETYPIPEPLYTQEPTMPSIIINEDGVKKLLQGVNPQKACGPDEIPAKVIKECAEELAPVLTKLFNKSLNTGEIPEDWLKANVAPIYKKGDSTEASNYRPVSLTCICCKLLEHIIVKQVVNHMEQHNLFVDCQHGFRSRRSCETQLVSFIQDLIDGMIGGGQTDVILLDFSKAFDKVPHQRLLGKMRRLGINQNTVKWVENFLTHRTQRVVLEGMASSSKSVTSGVPQGTVVGPLLFLIFINDMPSYIQHSQIRLFADDAVLYKTIKSKEDSTLLQQDLDNLLRWESQWQMSFHPDKCKVMNVTRSRTPKESIYNIRGQALETVTSAPYLGVTIDNKLTWTEHIDKLCKKANRTLGFLKRNLKTKNQDIKKGAYTSLVRPLLEYSCTVWEPYHDKLINKIEKIQNSAARYISNKPLNFHKPDSITEIKKDLKMDDLLTRRKKYKLSLVHKIYSNEVAVQVPTHPGTHKPYYENQTRLSRTDQCKRLVEVQAYNEQHRNSFFVQSIVLYNDLPCSIADAPSIETFKSRLVSYALPKTP